MRPTIAERFWAKVAWDRSTTDCWLWSGGKSTAGYGYFRISAARGSVGAHIFARELVTGSRVPPGKMVLHHCDVRHCVNPDHLYVGTQADNMGDMVARGRGRRFGRPPKLSFEEVRQIRESTATPRTIAAQFAIHRSYVWMLRNPTKYRCRISG